MPSINKIQLRTTAPRLTRAEISARKSKGKIDGWFGIAKVGRPAKAPITNLKNDIKQSKRKN